MYSRDEIKALVDKVLNMAKADAVEASFDGGERSPRRLRHCRLTMTGTPSSSSLKTLQVLPPGTHSLVVDESGKPKTWPPRP